jgi:hypothetical protein
VTGTTRQGAPIDALAAELVVLMVSRHTTPLFKRPGGLRPADKKPTLASPIVHPPGYWVKNSAGTSSLIGICPLHVAEGEVFEASEVLDLSGHG